jgi:hypothetical protein
LQCRTPRETNPKGHWGPNSFLIKSLFFFIPGGPGMSWVPQDSILADGLNLGTRNTIHFSVTDSHGKGRDIRADAEVRGLSGGGLRKSGWSRGPV